VYKQLGQRQRNWNEADGEKQVVDCRDHVKHIRRNSELFSMRMM